MYDVITKHDSPYYTPASQVRARWGTSRVIRGITHHHWGDPAGNPSFAGTVAYLLNNPVQSSAHIVGEAGRIAWLVNAEDMAYHAGVTANTKTIGLEWNPRASEADKATLAEVIADIRNVYGNLTLYPHNHFMATACPGRYNSVDIDERANRIFAKKYRRPLGPEIWI